MTVRLKLTMAFIAVVFVANSLLSLFTVKHFGRVWLGEVQSRVRLDLNSARESYDNHIQGIARFLEAAALDERIAVAMRDDDLWELERLLGLAYKRGGMDIMAAVAPTGQVRLRVHAPASRGDDVWGNPLISAGRDERSARLGYGGAVAAGVGAGRGQRRDSCPLRAASHSGGEAHRGEVPDGRHGSGGGGAHFRRRQSAGRPCSTAGTC